MKEEINFVDVNNKLVSVKVGDIIAGYTGLKDDVYKSNDPQIINGIRKAGEPKIRYGLILNIYNEENIDIIFASNTKGKKFLAKNKKGNRVYLLCVSTIRHGNPQRNKIILKKCSNNFQLEEPKVILNEILSSLAYAKFLKKKIIKKKQRKKIKVVQLKPKKEPELEM